MAKNILALIVMKNGDEDEETIDDARNMAFIDIDKKCLPNVLKLGPEFVKF